MEKGCSLCLDTTQKEQLKPELSGRIHSAAAGGHKTVLQVLLDMGAPIKERNSPGGTALLFAVHYKHLPCVKVLIERGADTTISTTDDISVLHQAAYRSTNSEMMKFHLGIVETRKLVDNKGSNDDTALHYCSFSDRQSPVIRLENAKNPTPSRRITHH